MTPKKLTGAEIRQTFMDFFVEHRHTVVLSSSLVPHGASAGEKASRTHLSPML